MEKNDMELNKESLEKVENEIRLYNDLDEIIKSYKEETRLSEKDIISVLERIKFQVMLDGISSQTSLKDKLDKFTRKWNLFKRKDKTSDDQDTQEIETETIVET